MMAADAAPQAKKMKILVGVDGLRTYRPVITLLGRLRFENARLTLAHAVKTSNPLPVFGAAEAAFGSDISGTVIDRGDAVVGEALEYAEALGLQSETAVLAGSPAPCLLEFAAREKFDLIAIHSVRKSALGSLFLGSVARGLAIGGSQSILISKGEPAPVGRINAVFATDHSPYATAALDKLIELGAKGIRKVHIVSAARMNEYDPDVIHYDASKDEGPTQAWLECELGKKNEAAAEKLRNAGFEVTTAVDPGRPVDAIRKAMDAEKADLLIMGAQGHGFIHRLFIGSTSLHQVVVEPYPVLVLRPVTDSRP
jgi:nucleotide-binding universal stress UspA family protein